MAEALRDLNEELGFPGADALYIAAKRRRIQATRAQARELTQQNERKQVLAQRQPSTGKTATESIDSRWMADLLIRRPDNNRFKPQYALICVNLFDRYLHAQVINSKQPAAIRGAFEQIFAEAEQLPRTITTDAGTEFTSQQVVDYVTSRGVILRTKDALDRNGVAVVDRAIGLIRRKIAELKGTQPASWAGLVEKAVSILNKTPKEQVLHGDAPEEVRQDADVRFMLLQDNAKKLEHNDEITEKRKEQIERTGKFRPLDETKKFAFKKRIDDATFQKVALRSDGITAGRVTSGGKSWPIKLVRPAR